MVIRRLRPVGVDKLYSNDSAIFHSGGPNLSPGDRTTSNNLFPVAPIQCFTVRQFQHYYLTRVPIAVRKRRAMGDRQYALTGRPKHGHALQHCPGPGAQYMIDATVADVYLVSVFDRTLVIGRPTVYLAMDVWSRMIVGVHVTLEPPSFEGVALVLENIVTPKDEFCARYGLRIGPDFWPCRYLPSIGFQTDHGSDYLKAQAWKTATQDLHVSISNVRVLDPLMRGLIERRFGIIPVQFQRASFGVVERDVTTRGAPRYARDATDTLTEFTRKLLRAILINMRMPIGHEGAQPEMVFQGIADTPFNRWSYGMDNFTGSLRKHSIDEVRMATWPHSTAVPTDRGLLWNGAYYTSDRIEERNFTSWNRSCVLFCAKCGACRKCSLICVSTTIVNAQKSLYPDVKRMRTSEACGCRSPPSKVCS